MIESPTNEKVKRVLRLQQKRGRKQCGQFTVEGAREIHRALVSGWTLEFLLVLPTLAENSVDAGLVLRTAETKKVWTISEAVFQKCAVRENQDGLLAVFQEKTWTFADVKCSDPSRLFLLALDGVEKPGNLGAVLRTADGAGVHGVILLGSSVDFLNPNVIRASLGTVFSIPVISMTDPQFVKLLTDTACQLITLSPEAEKDYFETQLGCQATVALFGNEAFGVRSEWKQRSQQLVRIPMLGIADSLNLSIAVALISYERLRQDHRGAHSS